MLGTQAKKDLDKFLREEEMMDDYAHNLISFYEEAKKLEDGGYI